MSKYKMYFLHDPLGNSEAQITNFDKEAIQNAINQGLVIVGVTQDGVREIVKSVEEVVEPQVAVVEGFTMVLPSYVDTKVDNLAKVVEKLVDGITGSSLISSLLLKNIKKSIQQIHEETLNVVAEDKKMLENSPGIIKKEM